LIVQTFYMILYLPVLAALAMLSGGLLAVLAAMVIKILPPFDNMVRIRRR